MKGRDIAGPCEYRGHSGACNPLSVFVHDHSAERGEHPLQRTAAKAFGAVSVVVKGGVGVVVVAISRACMLVLAIGVGGIIIQLCSGSGHRGCQPFWAVYNNLNSLLAVWRTQSSFRGSAGNSNMRFDPARVALRLRTTNAPGHHARAAAM
jgi:hypothetical protein